jgi:hypothetical protein
VVEKLYPVIVTPAPVVGGTKEIPIEVAAREVTANVPGLFMSVITSLVAGAVSAKPVSFPTTDRLYLVVAVKVVADVIVIFAPVAVVVPVIAVPPETGVSE